MHHDFQAQKCFISYAESHTDTRMLWESHCHAQYEMIAVLEGDVNITLDGRLCRLREHQVIIIPPLIYHTVSANTAGAYKRITALFDLCSVPQVLHQDFHKTFLSDVNYNNVHNQLFHDEEDIYPLLHHTVFDNFLYYVHP